MNSQVPLRVAVVGAHGRLGAFACQLCAQDARFEVVDAWGRDSDWSALVASSTADVVFEATRAGLGAAHALRLLECGKRVVVATSGVDLAQNAELDRAAREFGLGGLVVPNFSLGAVLLQRAAEQFARWFDAAEIIELHHASKADAPSGTALETARRIAASRAEVGFGPPARGAANGAARGIDHDGVAIHSVRMAGYYAHQEVLFGRLGETVSLRHDMSSPAAFGPGILAALLYARGALGIARGLEHALDLDAPLGNARGPSASAP